MSKISKIDQIRKRAVAITKKRNKARVEVPNLLAAILEDDEVEFFVKNKTTKIPEIQNLINAQIDQSDPRRDKSTDSPRLSKSVDGVLKESVKHIKQYQDELQGKDSLVILAVLLIKEYKLAPVKILVNNGIRLVDIKQYLDSFGIKLWDEMLLLEQGNSSYRPVISKEDDTDLSLYTQCLNDVAHAGKLSPTVGRMDEIEQVIRILRQKKKNNPLLIGEAGVGKTAIVEGLAQMAHDRILPPDLAGKKIFQLDLNALMAGTMYRGMLEERIKGIFEELAGMKDAILFIDEMHAVMDTGNFVDVMKPALARGELTCIGATTFDEYRSTIEKDKAHPDVFNVFLQVMDHGELTDSSGKTVDFRNIVLCMTSNVGEGGKSINSIGFGESKTRSTKDGEFEEMFKPEFRNRLDADIRFKPLTEKVMPQILDKVIGELEVRLKKRNAILSVTSEARGFLVEHGFDADMGARPLKRVFKQYVTDPVATELLEKDFEAGGGIIVISREGNGLSLDFHSDTSNDNHILPVVVKQPALIPMKKTYS